MVRHDIDDQAEIVRLEGVDETIERSGAAEVFAHPGGVDDVVAVLTPLRGGQKR